MSVRRLSGGQLSVLGDDDINRIHTAVLEVLSEVGVKVNCLEALQIMRDCGCMVDFDSMIVRTPEHVLKKCLATVPSAFTLYGRDPAWDVRVDMRNVYTIGGSSALFVLGSDGIRRPALLKDLEDLTRLLDSLPNLHIMHGIVNPQDIPQEGFDRRLFAAVMKNTARNYYSQALGPQGVRDQVEMASVIAGGKERFSTRPFFSIVLCMISPLVHPRIRVEELMECARLGVPIYVEVDAIAGATTPITLAGTLVEQSANVLTGVCLAQMIRPGLPCIYGIASGVMDMRTGNYSPGAPESQLLHAATAQVAHSYGLPCQGGTGIDAIIPDIQAGYERGVGMLTCALSGLDFVHLTHGMLEQMLTTSYEQCLIDDEILGAVFHILKGIEVNEETLAVDLIKEVGIGGTYITSEHTVKHMREVSWFPSLTNRNRWDVWKSLGGRDMVHEAHERVNEILREHHPTYLDERTAKEIDRMAVAFQNTEIEAVHSGKISY